MTLLKNKIAQNFSRAAARYDDGAVLQKTIAANLVAKAKGCVGKDAQILDLGSGTGFIAKNLKQHNIGNKIYQADIALDMCKSSSAAAAAICADIEHLPFSAGFFDVVLSSSSLQWVELEKVFSEVGRVLKSNGYFIFSIFGEKTLCNLKSSFLKAGVDNKINEFKNSDEIKEIIKNSGFELVEFSESTDVLSYANILELLGSIKNIGANTSVQNGQSITRGKIKLIENEFKKIYADESIKEIWQTYYFICKKSS